LPNGDVVAGANFHLTTSLNLAAISRWSGSSWSAMPGSGGIGDIDPIVNAMVQRADGALIVGGTVSASAEQFSPNLARFDSTCMPLAQPYGTGCSAAGPLVLTADALPWLAATFRTTTTGIAPFSLCLAATGFAQVSIPLASILAEGQPGCTLLAAPDILTVLLPDGAGTARTTLALPNNPALLGGVFFQQSLPLEFTGLFALVAVRASNALALTIGTL
jgi:hypothetical protein